MVGSVSGKFLLALGLALCACQVTEIKTPIAASAEMRVGSPARAWEVLDADGEVVGLLVYFRALGRSEDSLFMVRNVWHQDLGLVDAYGRAFRYLPHHRDPAWIGTGTVRQGVERILDLETCELAELPFVEPEHPLSPGDVEREAGLGIPQSG